jgi:hypothetical protein
MPAYGMVQFLFSSHLRVVAVTAEMSISTLDPRADSAHHQQVRLARRLRATLARRLRMLRWIEHDERRNRGRAGRYVHDEQTRLAIVYVEAAMAAVTRVAYATLSQHR